MVAIKDVPYVDRPREKFLKYGPAKLTDSELLAILLGTGIKGKNVLELSRAVLQCIKKRSYQSLTLETLMDIKGLGTVKAIEVLACIELGKRLHVSSTPIVAVSPRAVFESLPELRTLKKEQFLVIYLDTKNVEIHREVISIGTLNASLVHPREVFEPAIRHLAASVILVHNHPSGDPSPSEEDRVLTKRLVDAGQLLDIHVLDHIIIGKTTFMSLKEQGYM